MKIKNRTLLPLLFLSYLMFPSCSDKKPETNASNPFGTSSEAKILKPCSWSFSVEQNADGEAVLISTAKIDSGWHLYSQHISKKGTPTEFSYEGSENYKLSGNTEETEPHEKYDPNLEMDVLVFENDAVFKQKIKVLSKTDFTVTGTIDYMVCLEQCVLSEEDFSFIVKGTDQGI